MPTPQEILMPTVGSPVFHTMGLLVLGVTGFISLAFMYHWTRFSPSHFGAVTTMVVYLCGLAILVVGLLGILSTF